MKVHAISMRKMKTRFRSAFESDMTFPRVERVRIVRGACLTGRGRL